MIIKSWVVEIQSLVMNPKSQTIKSDSGQYQFLFKYVSSKVNVKTFQNKGKPYFGVIFSKKELFLKPLARYNCMDPPAFECQRSRIDCPSNQKLFYHYQHAKNAKSICSVHQIRYTWFKSPTIYKVSPIFHYAHPIIIKWTFSFPKFVSACKKSANFINSFLRYSRF